MSENKETKKQLTEEDIVGMVAAARRKKAEETADASVLPEGAAPGTEKVRRFVRESEKKALPGEEKPATPREQEDGIRGHSMNRYYKKMQSRKRRPKSSGFVRGLIVFAAVFLVIGILCTVAGWLLTKSGNRSTAETQMRQLVAENDADGWKQFLRAQYPASVPAYARGTDVAYKVLSPAFCVGKVTYFADVRGGNSVYALYSDGKHFADVYFAKTAGLLSRNETIQRVAFDYSYFDGLSFADVTVYVPTGATLTINGEKIGAEIPVAERSSAVYPGVSRGERKGTVVCDTYVFDCLYYVPELSAALNGQELELHRDDESHTYWFAYPAEMTHSITVTVPAEVDAYVGDALLTEDWAARELIDGELGSLDDGGTGTLPKLAVWTVDGLFGETDVRAEMDGTALTLLSENGHNYVFDTPAACTYTVTMLYPQGCTVKLNGRDLPQNSTVVPASVRDFAGGSTAFGSFDLTYVDTEKGTAPHFAKAVATGFLARPNVEVYSGSVLLAPAGELSERYRVRVEYDISSSAVLPADAEAASSAVAFFRQYVRYLCDGGTEEKPANRQRMDENHEALIAQTKDASASYFKLMDAYLAMRTAHPYAAHALAEPEITDVFAYTDSAVCLTLSSRVSCFEALPAPEPAEEEAEEEEEQEEPEEEAVPAQPDSEMTAAMDVLLVRSADGWHVWDYRFSTEKITEN